MPTLTLTIDTDDYQSPEHAARLAEELRTAAEHGEGITIRTAGARFTVDVTDVAPAPLDVWTAVGEFADDYNGEEPLVRVARTEEAARAAMALAVDEWLDGTITEEADPHSAEQTMREFRNDKGRAADSEDVAAWLHSFRLDYDLPIFFAFELNTLDA